ncbi:carboxylesterase 5A-like [Lineus longissimus]|uniref:carboxylesterase 5A-like n=1 Tax=Lineus longissimus TaxID=88925 RepID=UPI002B4E107F
MVNMDSLKVSGLLCFCIFSLLGYSQAHFVRVATRKGRVLGKRTRYDYGIDSVSNTVDAFLGVHYADQPVGNLRFRDPKPVRVSPPAGTNNLNLGPRCIQMPAFLYSVSSEADVNDTMREDCLVLNIYSPAQHVKATYPVMVWIHGGSLQVGSGNWFDGHVLAQFGVVVVTVNYRLGVLGFLSDGDVDSLPGDYGIFDQVMALRWIKNNIREFRGDPNKVTIFGSSAGAWSVSLHLLMKWSQGLFHRAIIQSGPLNAKLSHFNSPTSVKEALLSVGESLNCNTDDADLLLQCLRNVDAELFSEEEHATDMNGRFQVLWKGSRVLPTEPVKMLKQGYLNRVPVMIGDVQHEAARFLCIFAIQENVPIDENGNFRGFLDNDTAEVKHAALMESLDQILGMSNIDLSETMKKVVIGKYFTPDVMMDRKKITKTLVELFSDIIMVAPAVQTAKILRSRGLTPYFYMFSHSLSIDINNPFACSWLSDYSYHETELPFVFGNPISKAWSKSVWHTNRYTAQERNLSLSVMKLWADFARNGEPSPELTWEPFGEETYDYLEIKTGSFENKQNLRKRKVDFWIKIFDAREPNNT